MDIVGGKRCMGALIEALVQFGMITVCEPTKVSVHKQRRRLKTLVALLELLSANMDRDFQGL